MSAWICMQSALVIFLSLFCSVGEAKNQPISVDLRPWMPEPRHQGMVGSCSSHAVVENMEYFFLKKEKNMTFSPLHLYYNARAAIGKTTHNVGTDVLKTMEVASSLGVCEEKFWPYDVKKFKLSPSRECQQNAQINNAKFQSLRLLDLKNTLNFTREKLSQGLPVIGVVKVYDSLKKVNQSGDVLLPRKGERSLEFHAVLFTGYDDQSQKVTALNSWGKSWGQKGYAHFPYGYMTEAFLGGLYVMENFKAKELLN